MKASERQTHCKKLVTVLKKRYKRPLPKSDRPVLDVILFAICLENVSEEEAEAAFQRLQSDFHDYNELRVSSLSEIERAFEGASESQYRALRVRTVLQDIFENVYCFDFENLRKKTLETAAKQLNKLRHLNDFVRNYTLQAALGAHVVPLDDRMHLAVGWLGLAAPQTSAAEAAEELKSALRKSDAPLFGHLLRCLATDPALAASIEFDVADPPEQGFDPETAAERLDELVRSGGKNRKPKSAGKSRGKNSSTKKPAKGAAKKSGSAAGKKTKTKRPVASR